MLQRTGPPTASRASEPSFREFVALIALMMGVTAFAVDNLLPAFGPMRADLRIVQPNAPQLLIYGYMIAFALAQTVYGPISDIAGRRPVLILGLAIFAAGGVMAMLAPSFEVLMLARIIQGVGGAAARVLAVAIVRDRYSGRDMARVMSLAMLVFLTVPIFAPTIGTMLLLTGTWRAIFASMLILALVLAVWFGMRMPETLHPEFRFPFSWRRIGEATHRTVTTRIALGYATGVGLMMGCLMGYIGSSQQIFETTVYGLGPLFPLYFAIIGMVMMAAALVNARLVRRLGTRRLSHTAVLGFVATAAALLATALAFDGRPPLIVFMVLLSVSLFLFGLMVPNFNAMAMEPLGAIAGTASSLIGAFTTLLGALAGLAIGQSFDGTVTPLAAGYLLLGAACLAMVLWAERGRLFRPHHPSAATPPP